MFNVLPDIFKKEIKSEYFLRRLVVVFASVIFLQISFLIFLVPSWLSSFYRNKEASAEMQSQKSEVISKNADNVLQIINTTNQNLSVISGSFGYSAVLPLVKEIISDKTSAITLTEFTYDNSAINGMGSQTGAQSAPATSPAEWSVSGIAKTREDLVAFVKKLDDSETFSNVVSPISDLVKDKNISFVINFEATQSPSQPTP
jgi:hypothetical protein